MNTRRVLLPAVAALATLVLASGCGSSSGDDQVTVQTGSLSKAKFIEKADAICEAARTEFQAKYTTFLKAHQSDIGQGDTSKEEELFVEMIETVLGPNVEGQIEEIGKLGAPSDYAPKVEAFLGELQKRLGEAQDDPAAATSTPFPFKKAEDLAKEAGMQGCGESFS